MSMGFVALVALSHSVFAGVGASIGHRWISFLNYFLDERPRQLLPNIRLEGDPKFLTILGSFTHSLFTHVFPFRVKRSLHNSAAKFRRPGLQSATAAEFLLPEVWRSAALRAGPRRKEKYCFFPYPALAPQRVERASGLAGLIPQRTYRAAHLQ